MAEVCHRAAAEQYSFSKEIIVHYTVQANRKNRYAAKAYYTQAKDIGEKRKRSRRITNIIEKGLRGKTKAEVLAGLELIPFDDRVFSVIIADINRAYADRKESLSLKTIWFCCLEKLLKNRNYEDETAKKLFCGVERALSDLCPSMSREDDFTNAMERLYGCEWEQIKLKDWKQLGLILDTAVQEKFLYNNPISSCLRTLSSQASQKQMEARNAIVKKTFESDEELKMLKFITRPAEVSTDDREIKRYEIESVWLGGAIRLFTGMSSREICALQWKDLVKVHGVNTYQLWVTKLVSADGSRIENYTSTNSNKIRMIPVVSVLYKMLHARKNYLLKKQLAADLEECPIVLAKEEYKKAKVGNTSYVFCKPRYLGEKCKEIILAAEIPEQLIRLPDSQNEIVTDIFKSQGDMFQSNFKHRANHILEVFLLLNG